MPTRRTVTAVVALVMGGGAAIAIPAGVAVGLSSPPSTPIILRGTATIADRGVVATATALVACPSNFYGDLQISINERSGRFIASGTGYVSFPCTGQIETIKVPVVAYNVPFRAGTAFAQATSYAAGGSVYKTITLK